MTATGKMTKGGQAHPRAMGPADGVREHTLLVRCEGRGWEADFLAAVQEAGLNGVEAWWVRLYAGGPVEKWRGKEGPGLAVTAIRQSPGRGEVAVLAQGWEGKTVRRTAAGLEWDGGGKRHRLWTGVQAGRREGMQGATAELLAGWAARGGEPQDLVRTWFYLAGMDADYGGFVEGRKRMFGEWGLGRGRFPASTAIGGKAVWGDTRLTGDFLAVEGLSPGQRETLEAPDWLGPTLAYGVTFERGVKVRYGDRAHVYISGTASIGPEGHILHEGSLERQTERAWANLVAVLGAGGAGTGDLAYLVAYVRNERDREAVEDILQVNLEEGVPRLVVQGEVCRPGWLVELEGMAFLEEHDQCWEPY